MDKILLEEISRQRELMRIDEQGVAQTVLSGLADGLSKAIAKSMVKAMKDEDESPIDDFKGNVSQVNGKIKHSYTGKQAKMVNALIDEMVRKGITNPYTQIGILSVVAKESGFNAVKETGYCKTSNSRIRSIFSSRVSNLSDSELNNLKCNNAQFFDHVYGKNSGVRLGNTQTGDGWKYVGRGMNGITGRANYRKYGQLIGVDLENNPELLERPDISAKAAVAFFTKGKDGTSLPNFTDKESATKYFADINAGGKSQWARNNALAMNNKFEVVA